ncbi:MAG: ABC transporter ATP-binding protein [Hyphomicrobiales bacterium]
MMRLVDAGVRYGERWIFRHLSFELPIGRCLAILGPNGRGKTTLVRALVGFLALSEGRQEVPPMIGYVPQSIGKDVQYEVRQVVAMGRVARRGLFALPTRSDRDAADRALARVGISSLAHAPLDRLSGGERQLVLLARAIATDASILVLDEPASALDLRNQDRFLSVVDVLRDDGEHAIVFTTHLPQHASAVADEALLMFGTEDRVRGPVETVLTPVNLSRLYGLSVEIVEVPSPAGTRSVRGVVPLFGQAASR